MEETKTKEVGTIKKKAVIEAKGIQFLNGENNFKHANVPVILLNYIPPDSAHPFASGERFKLWFKLEDAQYKEIQAQLKKGLREISVWFDENNTNKLKEFLDNHEGNDLHEPKPIV